MYIFYVSVEMNTFYCLINIPVLIEYVHFLCFALKDVNEAQDRKNYVMSHKELLIAMA